MGNEKIVPRLHWEKSRTAILNILSLDLNRSTLNRTLYLRKESKGTSLHNVAILEPICNSAMVKHLHPKS